MNPHSLFTAVAPGGFVTRLAVAALCSLSLTAFAAPAKRGLAIGSSKEDEPCPARSTATGGADLAFLRGLTWAFEPAPLEIRGQAIEDLGLLGDPRALNPLAAMTLDANPAIAKAAVRAIGIMRHPRAEEILSNLVRHPTAPIVTKQLALSLLPFQNTATALRFIHFIAKQPTGSYELLQQARALSAMLPVPTPEQALPPLPPAAVVAPMGDSK
ncbi:MAG: HEAT repeat domain-containing protein [Archangium sp.]|nr:HEAT repeat domain-containing protein [Archangium sp.]